jgi:ubiquinone/menaquinone biosynthesis C-methylase UbiE
MRDRTHRSDTPRDNATEVGRGSGYEIEVIPGLEEVAEDELRRTLGSAVSVRGRPLEGRIAIEYRGDARRLGDLRAIVGAHAIEEYDVPRPRALLGHAHLSRLLALIDRVLRLSPPGTYRTFRLSAAGSDTTIFARLKEEIGRTTGLAESPDQADLLVAVRRPPAGRVGWEVVVRLGPRPLSARPWRVCNLPGALNATVAHAMVGLVGATASERFLNVACGSGTLLVERLELGPPRRAVGVDLDPAALSCARANLRASGRESDVGLVRADAGNLPFPGASFDTIVADLPFGMLVGSARENERLYPAILAEAARVAAPGASLVVITAARRAIESALAGLATRWARRRVIPIKLSYQSGYLRPAIFWFTRRD